MQTTLKKLIGGATFGLALLANTAPTWAGVQIRPPVTVLRSSAEGSMNGARYSPDSTQFIGCWTAGNPLYANAGCYAVDRNGASLSCVTHDPALIATVSSMTDSSILVFRTIDDVNCVDIEVRNSSAYLR